jgi:two-component system, OmpR family, response regulator PrrA
VKQDGPLVLVVDDDEAIRTALERALRLEGFAVEVADGGRRALELTEERRPGVIVLDVVMPDLSGVRVVSRLRERGIETPICILSARDEVEDRIAGLEAGADDYVVKPFDLEELVARLRALLRRASPTDSTLLRLGDLIVDPVQRSVSRSGRAIELTRREFELLEELVRHRGVVLSRQQLLERVWGYDFEVDGNVVDVFVGYLRRKLEAAGEPRIIHTVRGVGFVVKP